MSVVEEVLKGKPKDELSRLLRELVDLEVRSRRYVRGNSIDDIQAAKDVLQEYLDPDSGLYGIESSMENTAYFIEEFNPDLARELVRLRDATDTLMGIAYEIEKNIPCREKEDVDSCPANVKVRVNKWLKMAFDELRDILGRKCGFTIPNVEEGEEVDLSLAMNDLSNCTHVLAEELLKRSKPEDYEVKGKCAVRKGSEEWLARLCKTWDEETEEYEREGLYAPQDYKRLFGVVEGDAAMFRVGSSRGHATRVKLEDDRVSVKYFDVDRDVNDVISEIGSFKCDCKPHGEGVDCSCPRDEESLKVIAKLMALATSMDFRLREDPEYERERSLGEVSRQLAG